MPTKIRTEDGYIFVRQPDGSWSDGDMDYGSLAEIMQAAEIAEVEGPLDLQDIYILWEQCLDVPTNSQERIEAPWMGFPAGTPREKIWRWFESQHPQFVVSDVLCGKSHDS